VKHLAMPVEEYNPGPHSSGMIKKVHNLTFILITVCNSAMLMQKKGQLITSLAQNSPPSPFCETFSQTQVVVLISFHLWEFVDKRICNLHIKSEAWR